MSGSRNKSAWMWVAIAAITFASAARAEAGLQSAKAYAHPVLEFLARSQSQHLAVKPYSRFVQPVSPRQMRAKSRNASITMWMAILPVFFVGLVSPLTLVSAAFIRRSFQPPASTLIPTSFQRPPPLFF